MPLSRSRRLLGFALFTVAALSLGSVRAQGVQFFDGFADGSKWTVIANGGSGVVFDGQFRTSYGWGEISRSVTVPSRATVTLTVDVFNGQSNTIGFGSPTADRYRVSLGNSVVESTTIHGWQTVSVSAVLEANESVQAALGGVDNGFWAGWYGPIFDNAVIAVEGLSSGPSIVGSVDEGGTLTLETPNGEPFTSVLFASYGTPSLENGVYAQGWCHAASSTGIVAEMALGLDRVQIPATNGLFGDPCGGTYKRLVVALGYQPIEVPTTPESTTTSTSTTAPPDTLPESTSTTSTTFAPTTTSSSTSTPSTTSAETTTTVAPQTSPAPPVESTTTSGPPPEPTTTTTSVSAPPSTTLLAPQTTLGNTTTVPSTIAPTTTVPADPPPAVVLAELTEALEPDALETASEEEIEALIEDIAATVDDLSPEQQALLSEALTNAPPAVKRTFEAKVNVFSGGFDTYIPTGSNVSVRQRRALIAVTAALGAVPAVTRRS